LKLPDQILTGEPYPIKGVWTAFSNWVNQWPDYNRMVGDVLPRLDLLVTTDLFPTETTRWADYVLPAAHLFEREDLVFGPGPYVQYQPAILPPLGESRSDFEIVKGIATRLGVGEFFSSPPDHYLAEILADHPTSAHLSFGELKREGVLTRSLPDGPQVAHREGLFRTGTGRVEFYVEGLHTLGQALPDYEAPVEADPDGALIKRYPLVCISKTSRYRLHSAFGNAAWLREFEKEPLVFLNQRDAQAREIQAGDLVRVYNARGFVVLRAGVRESTPPGCVYLAGGWQPSDFKAGHSQSLTHNQGNPSNLFGPNSSFSDVLVEIAREAISEAGQA
jgi:molybdopterin-containing oxidoreductase family molybdopterin binding subunit